LLIFVGYVLFVAAVPLSYSEIISSGKSIDDPTVVDKITVKVRMYGTIEFEGDATKIDINLTIPSDHFWQKVIRFDPKCNLVKDVEGNTICNIVDDSPKSPYTYSLEFEIEAQRFVIENNDLKTEYPAGIEKYLSSTENIQSDDELIRKLAETITKDASDDFEKVTKIAKWIYENLEYDESYAGENKDALWVLNNRRGVCAEYTTLFIALARAIGIPARYVHVYAYGKNGWESHAIAEVYLGRWVPVDALWMEVGWVDATHIFFGSYTDNQISTNVRVEGFNIRDVVWSRYEIEFETIQLEKVKDNDLIDVFTPNTALSFGGKTVVVAEISPTRYGVDILKLLPCKGVEVVQVYNPSAFVIEAPEAKKFAYWLVEAKKTLDPKYIYSCPLVLNSMFNLPKTKKVVINVSDRSAPQFLWNAELAKEHVSFGDEQYVIIRIDKLDNNAELFVGHETFLREFGLSSKEVPAILQVKYKPTKKGEDEIYVFDNVGNAVMLTNKVRDRGNNYIEHVAMPRYVRINTNASANITIVNKERTAGMILEVNNEKFKIPAEYNTIINVLLSTNTPGKKYLKLRLVSASSVILDEKFYEYEVIIPPAIELVSATRKKSDEAEKITVELYSTSTCMDVKLFDESNNVVGNAESIYEGRNTLILNLQKDSRIIKLECRDLSGQQVTAVLELRTNLINRILRFIFGLMEGLNDLMSVVL
jgi:hypothetical protein